MSGRIDRPAVAATLVLVPAIAAALLVVALEAGRVWQPDDPLFRGPPPRSLHDAIVDGDVETAFAFIQAGQDPNHPVDAPWASTEPRRTIQLTPLVLAVAARDANVVRMLLSVGVDLTRADNRLALCLARELRENEVTTLLARAIDGELACPARAVGRGALNGQDR
jgi:hypothetical protein